MLIQEVAKEQCEELIGEVGFWRLACTFEGQPYIVPLYLAYAPGELYGFATMGQKIDWMRANPQVCVETDNVHSQTDWWSVVVQGRFEEFPDTGGVCREEAGGTGRTGEGDAAVVEGWGGDCSDSATI